MNWRFLNKGRLSGSTGRLLAVLMVGAMALSTLVAAPGQGKGGHKKANSSTGQCSVTPNPAMNGQETFTVNGSGFSPGITVDILVGGGMFLFASVDDSGNFSTSAWTAFSQTGTQEVKVYKMGDKRERILASCSFMVN